MKKQFFRVKQLADQTFSRAGKTEALSEDLVIAEKRIEFLNKICQNVSKKISSFLGSGQDMTAKRISKSPEFILGEVLTDSCNGDVDDIKDILIECSRIQMRLANASGEIDTHIEADVLLPLQQIVEVDVPNILKQKRYLTRLILDMDSAKNRYQAALKHTSNSASTGSTTKADSIKDELEDIEMKVEQCRDTLACDMFQLISKQAVLVNALLEYIKLQQQAHRRAVEFLDEVVPELESKIESSAMKPVFHLPLEEHLRVTNRKIAYPLELCVCVLLELGMEEEGLFRIAGGTSKMRRLKYGFDVGFITMETAMEYRDVHVFTSVLKSYFRELPEPLLTNALYEEWLATTRYVNDDNARLQALWTVLHKLPQGNFDNLRYFIKFLSNLTKNQDVNKMTAQNLAIVIAPNLIWSPYANNSTIGENMNLVNQYSSIIELLIKFADWFFPGDETFYVTLEEPSAITKTHMRSSSADMRSLNIEFATATESNSIKRCQSTTSLEEQIQNCPLPESPKPIMRTRKNKPAPTPPTPPSATAVNSSSSPHSVSTVTISTSPSFTSPTKEKCSVVKVSVQHNPKKQTYDLSTANDDVFLNRRESFTYIDYSEKSDVSDNDKEERSSSRNQSKLTTDESFATEVPKPLNADSGSKLTESKKIVVKPVPAPRTSLETLPRFSSEDVIPRKPVIPEKPTTLPRPLSCSFKPFKASDPSDVIKIDVEKHKGPSLEKAHLYTVDKQQVSFIDIASNSDELVSPESNQDTSALSRSRSNVGSVIDANCGEKSEHILNPNGTFDRGQNSSHTRALSDGHSIDTLNPASLPPLRNFSRVQRPIPPPPPPPVTGKSQSRPGSVSDSTNL